MRKAAPKWAEAVETQAFLVAMDISGFSRDLDPDRLLAQRHNFFHAVEQTRQFKAAQQQRLVKVHFLGDELRLAFHIEVGAPEVRDFILDVFAWLRRSSEGLPPLAQTQLRACALAGPVVWGKWHNCHFLDGDLPLKAQAWLAMLTTLEAVVDSSFKQYLDVAGVAARLAIRKLGDEAGYSLST